MTNDEMIAYCLSKPEAYDDRPFDQSTLCIRKRIFAIFFSKDNKEFVTMTCLPDFKHQLSAMYPTKIHRAYHCPESQQPYRYTLQFDESIPDDHLRIMVDHAYKSAVERLPKREQKNSKLNSLTIDGLRLCFARRHTTF